MAPYTDDGPNTIIDKPYLDIYPDKEMQINSSWPGEGDMAWDKLGNIGHFIHFPTVKAYTSRDKLAAVVKLADFSQAFALYRICPLNLFLYYSYIGLMTKNTRSGAYSNMDRDEAYGAAWEVADGAWAAFRGSSPESAGLTAKQIWIKQGYLSRHIYWPHSLKIQTHAFKDLCRQIKLA